MAIAFQLASLLAISPRQFPLFAKYSNRMIFKKQELGRTIPHSNSSGACQLSQNKTQSPCTVWPPATLDTVSSHFPFSHPFKPHGFPYCSSNIPGLVSALVPFLILFFCLVVLLPDTWMIHSSQSLCSFRSLFKYHYNRGSTSGLSV